MVRAVTLAALVAIAASGCGGDDDGLPPGTDGGAGDGGGDGVPLDAVPARIAGVYCEQIEACLGAFAEFFLGATDCEQRFTRMLQDTQLPNWRAAIDSGAASYHADRMEECLAEFAGLGCDIFYSRIPPACQAALQGTVPIGGACSENIACRGDAFCEFAGSCLTGTCAAPAPAGAPCATDEGCATGTACDASDTCRAPVRAGGACGATTAECHLGTLCIGRDDGMGVDGACTAIDMLTTEALGAACDPDRGLLCQAGLACTLQNPMAPSCVTPAPDFGVCHLGFPDPCPRGQYCNATTVGVEGDCTALPASGSPCRTSPFPGAECGGGLTCAASGVCVPIERLGGSCSDDSQCYSHNCDLSSCMLPNRCL